MPSSDPRLLPLAGVRVLLVEDHWQVADAMRSTIEQAGGTVVGTAGALDKAERLAAAGGFDAVVIDLDLRSIPSTPLALRLADQGKKVVLVTAYDVPPVLQGKVHCRLRKPATSEDLINALRP